MDVGLTLTKKEINDKGGEIARALHYELIRVAQFKYFLDAKTDADLKLLGFTDGSVDPDDNQIGTLRSAFADLNELETIYRGGLALAIAKDFRTFAKRIMGMGPV